MKLVDVPDDLWNENCDRVWIRHDLCASAAKARYKAWSGAGLPVELYADSLIDLGVRVVWARHEPDGGGDEWPWKRCDRSDPGASKFWEVSAA